MCLLFPVLSLGWKKGDEEVISSGLLLDILHSGSKESEEIYRWMMFIFWPLKVIWCLLVWIGIGLFLSARLGLRFLRWSYRLIFTWPERKTADGKPKEPTKAASQEHTVN